jgi:tetratricopeptide (TPR) repeat protein
MAIEGPLKELNIHDVFQLLDLGRKTGVLRVTSELRQNAGVVHFERGAVIGAQITSNPHPLGELLLRAGKLREEDLARGRALQEAGDRRRLGEILVAIDALGGRELDRCVRAQVEEVVFELMSWSEGYFSFVEGHIDRSGIEAPVSIATEALLMEAARRIDEWARIESKVPHLGVVPRLRAPDDDGGAPLDLVPFEWEVLAAVDGARDLRSIADSLGRSDFDVARTIYGLTSAGVVILDAPAPAPAAQAGPTPSGPTAARVQEHLAMGDFESARLAAVDLVAADPERAEGYAALGDTLLRLARWEEAEEALVQALHRDPTAAAPRRLLALAQVAQGRFADAIESCDRWTRADAQSGGERDHAVAVARVRDAARALSDALRERHV